MLCQDSILVIVQRNIRLLKASDDEVITRKFKLLLTGYFFVKIVIPKNLSALGVNLNGIFHLAGTHISNLITHTNQFYFTLA